MEAAGNIGLVMFKVGIMVLALMAMAYPVYRVVSLWFDRALAGTEAVIYLTLLLFLFLGIIAGWGTPVGYILFLGLIVGCLAFPLLNRAADRVTLRRLEDSDIRKFSETLRSQPRNVYYRERLARIFLARKEYDLAIMQLQEALAVQPKDRNLEVLLERVETERRRVTLRLKVCPKCFTENPPELSACMSCGFLFVDPSDLLRVFYSEPALRAAKWTGLGMLLAGLLLLFAGGMTGVASLLMVVGMVSLFWYLYVRFNQL